LSRGISLNPKFAEAYNLRSMLKKLRPEDVQGALADLNQTIALNPKDANAYSLRGSLKKQNLNDVRGAFSDMQQALKLYQQQGNQLRAQDAIDILKRWQGTSNNSGF
jgi:Flp pilus assembly protein TadD